MNSVTMIPKSSFSRCSTLYTQCSPSRPKRKEINFEKVPFVQMHKMLSCPLSLNSCASGEPDRKYLSEPQKLILLLSTSLE